MHDMILKTLTSEGPLSAGQIAELIGEDAESVKIELQDMVTFGLVVKNGRHRYQANSKNAESTDGKPEFGKPAQSATDHIPDAGKMIPEPQQQPQRSLSEVLDAMEARLRATPPTCRAIDVKLTVLKRLASCSNEPVRSILSEICDDLEAMNRHA